MEGADFLKQQRNIAWIIVVLTGADVEAFANMIFWLPGAIPERKKILVMERGRVDPAATEEKEMAVAVEKIVPEEARELATKNPSA